jgi:hypothetical protein
MALTFSEIETLYDAAQAAMAAEEWSSAISKLMQLQACLAATPNASRGSSGGNQAYTFNPQGSSDGSGGQWHPHEERETGDDPNVDGLRAVLGGRGNDAAQLGPLDPRR